jgi:hypothetical protein
MLIVYIVIALVVLASIAAALYAFLKKGELARAVADLERDLKRQESREAFEVNGLRSELAKLEKFRRIPDVLERAKATEREIAVRVEQAQQRAHEVIRLAHQEANGILQDSGRKADAEVAAAREARGRAEAEASNTVALAQNEAKEIASLARKEAKAKSDQSKEKLRQAEESLDAAASYALDMRRKAEKRAEEIAGSAYEAKGRLAHYESAVRAMENALSGYGGTYAIPSDHLFDELAEDYGFKQAGEKLKLARERTRIMEKNGTAAACNYPEGWKRDYAVSFVLGAFNGKVDSILARLKPANQGKLVQEIKDTFALVNRNGEVFRNARIQEEFLDARLDELKWAVAVQRIRDREKEEQRAIREQMRDEERARKEYEKAVKQARREEELLARALEQARREYEAAAGQDRAQYEAKLQHLEGKLTAAEEKNRRAISMAQQTKKGVVYVISNIGSFGEDVYKIGLTRRLDPFDRVRELGDASVPFPFDVHAMIRSDDAPALEAALHKRFVQSQMNKANRRKEFFRLNLREIREAVEGMKTEAVKWTLVAEARDYRETQAMERQMQEDPEFRRRWAEDQAAYEQPLLFDDEGDGAEQEEEAATLGEGV